MSANVADRYGIVGYPVSHSRSPVIHRLFAQQTGQDLHYDLLEVMPARLEKAIRQFQRTGGKGLNITVPYKGEVGRFIDEMSERASNAGAINTLVFEDSKIFGDNTDGVGLLRDLESNLELTLKDANILILGAGGATRGIIPPLLDAEPKSLTIANRTLAKAQILAQHFSGQCPVTACCFDEVDKQPTYSLVINATSAGLKGETPPYPEQAVSYHSVCYDLSYSLTPTPFSRWGTEHGAGRSIMGWGMLVEQAAESFYLWRGVRPDTAAVLKQMSVNA